MTIRLERLVKPARLVDILQLLWRSTLKFLLNVSFSESCRIWIGDVRILACHTRLENLPRTAAFYLLLFEVLL